MWKLFLEWQLNITSYPDVKNGAMYPGKSVKDDAMYNAECRDLVHAKGGENIAPPVKMLCEQIMPGHKWHRGTPG